MIKVSGSTSIALFIVIAILCITGAMGEYDDQQMAEQYKREAIQSAQVSKAANVAEFNRLSKQGEEFTTFQAAMK